MANGPALQAGTGTRMALGRRIRNRGPINREQEGNQQGGAPGILGLMEQRQAGTGLYSRTNVGTQPTARERANDAGTFARAVDPQGTLEDRPSPQDVRDPFVDNATRRGIRSGIEDQSELRQDLVSGGGMNPVEYRAGLQALQATNQGLQPLMEQRTATDTAEMQEIGATNRQLLGIDNTRMQGAMNLAQQAMQGDQQMDLARLEGGLALDETLMGGMADREVAAIEGQYNRQQAAMENAMNPAERMRLQLINEETQGGGLGGVDAINALSGEPIDDSQEYMTVNLTGQPGGEMDVPRDVGTRINLSRIAEQEGGMDLLLGQPEGTAARRYAEELRDQQGQEGETQDPRGSTGFWETRGRNIAPGLRALFQTGQGGLLTSQDQRRRQNGNGSSNNSGG